MTSSHASFQSLLKDQLQRLNPRSSQEFIASLRGQLDAIDSAAEAVWGAAKASRRGEVFEMEQSGFALPPGAAQCPQATYQRFGSVYSLSAGTVFTSYVSHLGLAGGKYMYEVDVASTGSMQIGFCGPMNMFLWDHTKGVGDFPFTVAYDGCKCKLLNVSAIDAGWEWSMGDTIGVTFDLDIGEVTYYQNGKLVTSCSLPTIKSMMAAGVPHSDKDVELCYFPAISMAPWQHCRINTGGYAFMFPVDGFRGIDTSDDYLRRTWIPRLGALDEFPPHLERYRGIAEHLMLAKVIGDPGTNFMGFAGLFMEYLLPLHVIDSPRAVALIACCKRVVSPDMHGGLLIVFFASCSAFSQYAKDERDRAGWMMGSMSRDFASHSTPNLTLSMLEFLLDEVPEAVDWWVVSPTLQWDLSMVAGMRQPNEMDLRDLFPEVRDGSVLEPDGIAKMFERQERIARERVEADELARHRIFVRVLAHPGLRAQLTQFLYRIVTQLKEVARDSSKRVMLPVYTDRTAVRIYFQIVCATAARLKGLSRAAVAEIVCPLSVLRMAKDYDNFSGIPHADLLESNAPSLFANVPEVAPNSPECLFLLLSDLYTLVVRGWLADAFKGVMVYYAQRDLYLKLRGSSSSSDRHKAASLKAQLLARSYSLSWTMTSLYVRGFHGLLTHFAMHIIHMVDHYETMPQYAQFIPAKFIEWAVDLLHFTRKTSPHLAELRLREDVACFLLRHFCSPIIHHQATREYILMTVGGLISTIEVQRRQFAKYFRTAATLNRHFMSQLFDLFGNPMAWTLVVNPIYRNLNGNGFCAYEMCDPRMRPIFPPVETIPPEEFTSYDAFSETFLRYFEDTSMWATASLDSSPLGMLRNAIKHTNWCVTELGSVLSSTTGRERVTSSVVDLRNRGASVYLYCVKMLRIVEGTVKIGFNFFFNTTDNNAGTVPSHNAPPISASSKALLVVELVGQCLSRFAYKDSSLRRVIGLGLEVFAELDETSVIAPLVGTLVNMMGPIPKEAIDATADIAVSGAASLWQSRDLPVSVIAYVEELVRTNVFFRQMAQPRVDWNHACVTYALTGIDWAEVCRKAHSNSNLLKALPLTAMAYEALQEERQSSMEAASDTSGDAALCPICCVSGLEVVFEPCGHSSCLPCIERHQISDRRCFFCKVDVQSTRPYVPSSV